jgi:hypothetical protein
MQDVPEVHARRCEALGTSIERTTRLLGPWYTTGSPPNPTRRRGWRPALTYGSTNNLLLAAGSGVRRAEPTLVVYWEVIPLLTAALSVCYLLTVLLGYPDVRAASSFDLGPGSLCGT